MQCLHEIFCPKEAAGSGQDLVNNASIYVKTLGTHVVAQGQLGGLPGGNECVCLSFCFFPVLWR